MRIFSGGCENRATHWHNIWGGASGQKTCQQTGPPRTILGLRFACESKDSWHGSCHSTLTHRGSNGCATVRYGSCIRFGCYLFAYEIAQRFRYVGWNDTRNVSRKIRIDVHGRNGRRKPLVKTATYTIGPGVRLGTAIALYGFVGDQRKPKTKANHSQGGRGPRKGRTREDNEYVRIAFPKHPGNVRARSATPPSSCDPDPSPR